MAGILILIKTEISHNPAKEWIYVQNFNRILSRNIAYVAGDFVWWARKRAGKLRKRRRSRLIVGHCLFLAIAPT